MTRLQELLLARLRYSRADLDEAFPHLEGIELSWAPAEGMRTVGGQLEEIAATEMAVIERLKLGRSDTKFAEVTARCVRDSLLGYRELLDEIRAETNEFVMAANDDELETDTQLFKGWHEMMGLTSIPVAEAIRTLASHEAYHTGQIVSYLWSRGDDPYDW